MVVGDGKEIFNGSRRKLIKVLAKVFSMDFKLLPKLLQTLLYVDFKLEMQP